MTAAGPDDICDLRGLICPLPVLRTAKRLSTMTPGALLTVETTDPLARIDIAAFCSQQGHRLIEVVAIDGGDRFTIERG